MKFLSTRGGEPVSAAMAIETGIAPSGGLYVPETFPVPNMKSILEKADSYVCTAIDVMHPYLSETTGAALAKMVEQAYSTFDTPEVVPLVPLDRKDFSLELWHGPTMAFKDVALQMLPHLMTDAVRQNGSDREVYILVATSGDTGKAALSGFCNVPGTRVLVFYPHGGVSRAQRLQMVTQEGSNVDVCAIRGNFDDAQTGVKNIFADPSVKKELDALGYRLSSANSINFGRLLPQIVYYFSAYARLLSGGHIKNGQRINFCVPTGNFGDILAGYYALSMGLPINRLIAASNRNNVLTDFFRTGVYDASRPFYKSMSCSIDILISSNLERLLFEMAGRDAGQVNAWMTSLKNTSRYDVGAYLNKVSGTFYGGCCDETQTLSTIRDTFESTGYLIDPHTAVGQTVLNEYRENTGDDTVTVLLSTANPYKFATDVLGAFETAAEDDFENVERLSKLSGAPVPKGISELLGKKERHLSICEIADMRRRVIDGVLQKAYL